VGKIIFVESGLRNQRMALPKWAGALHARKRRTAPERHCRPRAAGKKGESASTELGAFRQLSPGE